METTILINQKLDASKLEVIRSLGTEDDPVLLAVVGEISKHAQYSTCVLLATGSCLFIYDFKTQTCSERYSFKNIHNIFNKRMYGNGMMRVKTVDGKTKFVCIDGPEFDAHKVDFDEMIMRLKSYN